MNGNDTKRVTNSLGSGSRWTGLISVLCFGAEFSLPRIRLFHKLLKSPKTRVLLLSANLCPSVGHWRFLFCGREVGNTLQLAVSNKLHSHYEKQRMGLLRQA